MNIYELHEWWEGFPSCGCGQPETVAALLRDTLDLFSWSDEDHPQRKRTGESSKDYFERYQARERELFGENARGHGLYWAWLYLLDHFGLTEHGGGAAASWLTGKGDDVLAALREHGTEPKVWLEAWVERERSS